MELIFISSETFFWSCERSVQQRKEKTMKIKSSDFVSATSKFESIFSIQFIEIDTCRLKNMQKALIEVFGYSVLKTLFKQTTTFVIPEKKNDRERGGEILFRTCNTRKTLSSQIKPNKLEKIIRKYSWLSLFYLGFLYESNNQITIEREREIRWIFSAVLLMPLVVVRLPQLPLDYSSSTNFQTKDLTKQNTEDCA